MIKDAMKVLQSNIDDVSKELFKNWYKLTLGNKSWLVQSVARSTLSACVSTRLLKRWSSPWNLVREGPELSEELSNWVSRWINKSWWKWWMEDKEAKRSCFQLCCSYWLPERFPSCHNLSSLNSGLILSTNYIFLWASNLARCLMSQNSTNR